MRRIAVIFDPQPRPETTGVYVRRALGQLLEQAEITALEHLTPGDLTRRSAGDFDLYVAVDDGLDYEIPAALRPRAWWAIDTHLSWDRCLARARASDWTFAAQREGTQQFQEAGISATWLPLACDPAVHGRRLGPTRWDWAFVGHLVGNERPRLLQMLTERFPAGFAGQAPFTEMAEIYSRAKIVFNRSVADDVNMRVFEGLASGALLLTNRLESLSELFTEDREYVAYGSDEELCDKLEFYRTHDDARRRIADAGRQAVLARHTYLDRVRTILAQCANHSAATSAPVRSAVAAKPSHYFEFDRPDVLAMIPASARRVLDIGCGSGRLGAAIKARQSAYVAGIELHPAAAQRARMFLDAVYLTDIETCPELPSEPPFDCIVCADVLEHLREPLPVLRRLREWLTPDGVLVSSLPNVRNHTVVQALLAGNWTYEPAGLQDADHVRFFTRREIEKLHYRAGLEIGELRLVPGEGFAEWNAAGNPRDVRVGGLTVRAADSVDAAEFYTYQFLSRARPNREVQHELTSIIIVTYNQLAYTRQCVESIQLRTDEPYELVFVDNGSTDGTVEYLKSIPGATVIENAENRGFPAAANQGLQAALGVNLLLLNNDVIVTTGWLRRQLDVLASHPSIGLVGPVSNSVSGPQQVEAHYASLSELDGYAWSRQWSVEGPEGVRAVACDVPAVEVARLVGFCLLAKRVVLETIGLLDERFGIGNFEDDDLCRRAREAGFRCLIATAAYVHHFGSVTFRATGVDFSKLLAANSAKYREKWKGSDATSAGPDPAMPQRQAGLAQDPAAMPTAYPLRPPRPAFVSVTDESGELCLVPNTVRLSLCVIVRDNERTIRACLESIRPWVDEMVIVDTGSTDRTPEICAELGARVFHWPWCDDFAAARNESLKHARGEWLFWMDSDDTIPAECGRRLRELVDADHPEDRLGYVLQVHCPGREPHERTVVDHVKLFRNRPDLSFEFRIHEQILPAIRRAGGEVAFTDIHVVHSGCDQSPEGRQRKVVRDLRILQEELNERPDHPFALFNLGMTYADAGRPQDAIPCLRRSIALATADESHLRKAYALLVGCLAEREDSAQALDVCRSGLHEFPDDPELRFRHAMLLHQRGDLAAAVGEYQSILDNPCPPGFASIDDGLAGYKARHNLAVVLEELGETAAARAEWERILTEQPWFRPAWSSLATSWLRSEHPFRFEQVEELTSRLLADSDLAPEAERLRALVLECRGEPLQALRELCGAVTRYPDDLPLYHEYCRVQFTYGGAEDSVVALKRLASLVPQDGTVRHNLGLAWERVGAFAAAAASYDASLALRPGHAQTFLRRECARQQDSTEHHAGHLRHESKISVATPHT